MSKLIIIVGLSGSGKTELIKCRIKPIVTGTCEEDYHKGAPSAAVDASNFYKNLIIDLEAGKTCAIADIAFTKPDVREELQVKICDRITELKTVWIFFENNLCQCIKNILTRGSSTMCEDLIYACEFSKSYQIPEKSMVYAVYDPSAPIRWWSEPVTLNLVDT